MAWKKHQLCKTMGHRGLSSSTFWGRHELAVYMYTNIAQFRWATHTYQFLCLATHRLHSLSPVLLGVSPPPSLLLPLPVTRNFIPAFYFQLFFFNNLRESRCTRRWGMGVAQPSSSPLGAGFHLPSSLAPIHNFVFCSWSPLLYKSIQKKNFF